MSTDVLSKIDTCFLSLLRDLMKGQVEIFPAQQTPVSSAVTFCQTPICQLATGQNILKRKLPAHAFLSYHK
jgi:hypothetical protein